MEQLLIDTLKEGEITRLRQQLSEVTKERNRYIERVKELEQRADYAIDCLEGRA